MGEELKPCPFCTEIDDFSVVCDNYTSWNVRCNQCKSRGPAARTADIAREIWNARPESA